MTQVATLYWMVLFCSVSSFCCISSFWGPLLGQVLVNWFTDYLFFSFSLLDLGLYSVPLGYVILVRIQHNWFSILDSISGRHRIATNPPNVIHCLQFAKCLSISLNPSLPVILPPFVSNNYVRGNVKSYEYAITFKNLFFSKIFVPIINGPCLHNNYYQNTWFNGNSVSDGNVTCLQ